MKDSLHTILCQSQLVDRFTDYLVAVSGGVDSMVLLHLLKTKGYRIRAAHCNFNLRGEDSNRDEQFVRAFCKEYAIPLEVVHFETEKVAQEKHWSIEMTARELRYAWFEEQRQKYSCARILVAHHADDAIETFFLNLIRGCGLRGLQGMPAQNGFVARPLLKAKRSDIEAYAQQESLDFCQDVTNADTIYRRNYIRHTLLPLFQDLTPNFQQTMLDNLQLYH